MVLHEMDIIELTQIGFYEKMYLLTRAEQLRYRSKSIESKLFQYTKT